MTATVTYPRAGQVEPGWEIYVETLPANSGDGGIAAGLIGTYVTKKVVVNPTDGSGRRPFVGVIEAKADTDTLVRVLTYGLFYGYAEGAIVVGDILIAGSTTAGHVKAGVRGGGTPTSSELIIGDYFGHAGEGSGNSPITDAANGDIICIFLR